MTEHMKGTSHPNSEWLNRLADAEDRCPSVTVGGLAQEFGMLHDASVAPHRVFGRLIEYARRAKGWTIEALATSAGVGLDEVVAVETEAHGMPTRRTVDRLARVLELPPGMLSELAGFSPPRETLIDAAVRFAARCEPINQLTENERAAFDEFVKAIVDEPCSSQ